MSIVRFLSFDNHADTLVPAIAEPDGEVRRLPTIPNRLESLRKSPSRCRGWPAMGCDRRKFLRLSEVASGRGACGGGLDGYGTVRHARKETTTFETTLDKVAPY